MSIVLAVPHAKEPGSDQSALAFLKNLESVLTLREMEYYSVLGNKPKKTLDLATQLARGTSYSDELSIVLGMSEILIEIQSHNDESDVDYSDFEFVIGELPSFTDEDDSDTLMNTIDQFGDTTVEKMDPKEHYAAVLSEIIFKRTAIILSVNSNSNGKFIGVAEVLVDFVADSLDRRISMAHS